MIKTWLRQGELGCVLTHGVGFMLSIGALVVLIVTASINGTAWHVTSFTIFGASLILLYGASTVYHAVPHDHAAKNMLCAFDNAMIYVLIAGTYTPVCLTALRGPWGWSIFGIIWGLALMGIALKFTVKRLPYWLTTVFYLILGWLVVVALMPLLKALPRPAIIWMVSGGLFYTAGVIFFALDRYVGFRRWFSMHNIFHLFVLAGSFSHVWLAAVYLIKPF